MNEFLQQLLDASQVVLWTHGLVFLRVGAIVSVLPGFGEQMIPSRIKLAVALMLTVLVAPLVPIPVDADMPYQRAVGLLLSEVAIGFLFGMSLRLLSHCLLIAGSIAAQATSLSQLFGGSASSEPQPAMANLIYIAGLTLVVMTGLHIKLVSAAVELYAAFPVGSVLPGADVTAWGVASVAHAFALAFVLAAPFVLASVLYNVAMGVINKAMPQLMVAFVGAPAITAGGLIILLLALPIMLPVWFVHFERTLAAPMQVLP